MGSEGEGIAVRDKSKVFCDLLAQLISEVYLHSHLRGAKHLSAMASRSAGEEEAPVITEAAEEHQGPDQASAEMKERHRAGKKRVKKLRQKMASRFLFV